jgi:hypothetical protein
MPIRQIVRPHPLSAQYRTLSNVASKGVAEAVATTQAAKAITDSITSDPDIIGLSGGNAALSDPQIDSLGATASNNLDVYNGGGA